MPLVLIVGSESAGSLESSYGRAFKKLGWDIFFWNPVEAASRSTRGGRIGRILSQFVRVEPWLTKANRELIIHVLQSKPELILTFTHPQMLPGALAQVRASVETAIVQIWPDPLQAWLPVLSANLPLYDLVATYSQATAPIFEKMGAQRAIWLPFAGDPELHPADVRPRPELAADVSFVGGWRPERETILSRLDGFELKIWGPDWGRRCRSNRAIMRAWQGRALRGTEFAQAVRSSKINLNIIDPTNYPAANMRFFEIPTAGGLQVCSPCAEMEDEFQHGRHLYYYQYPDNLSDLLQALLAEDAMRIQVATAGHEQVLSGHTYVHRARQLLQQLEIEP